MWQGNETRGETWSGRHLGKPGVNAQLKRVTASLEDAVWSVMKPLASCRLVSQERDEAHHQ